MQRSPSVYSDNRKAAFLHTLQRFEQDQYDKVPMFIFGDFNFRLDINLLVQDLTAKTKSQQIKGKKDQVAKIVYTEEGNGKVVLTVETKGFDHHENTPKSSQKERKVCSDMIWKCSHIKIKCQNLKFLSLRATHL